MKKLLLIILSVTFCFLIFPFSACKKNNKITSYEIECELKENVLKGVEKVSFYNDTSNAFTNLKFNLFPNAFREGAEFSPIAEQYKIRAYKYNVNYGDIKINSVISKGKELEFSIEGEDENILNVKLENEVFPKENVEIEISFVTTLAKVVSRTGINARTINLANFYPILCGIENDSFYECVYYSNGDPFFSDVANYKVSITCDSEYVIASSGKVVSSKISDGLSTTTFEINKARSFSFVLCKDYESISENVNGTEVNYYYYNDVNPKESLSTAVKAMKYFSYVFGEYPYPTYSVAQTQFIQGGMEFPALTFISDDLEQNAYYEVIVHETAHMWWQSVVGNNEVEYGFLDEGLAEYSVVLFYENFREYGFERENLVRSSLKTYQTFCSVEDKLFKKVDTSMLRSLKDFNSEYEYVNIAYVKPVIMYDSLRKGIGDENFFKGLRQYYEDYSYKCATPYDLVRAFSKVNTMGDGFFEGFFNGKVIL